MAYVVTTCVITTNVVTTLLTTCRGVCCRFIECLCTDIRLGIDLDMFFMMVLGVVRCELNVHS